MPELSDALHELYDAEARLQVLPARGMNVLAGEARSVRRRTMARSGLVGAVGAVAVAALVVGGVQVFGSPTAPGASPSASPSPSVGAHQVTWNPEPEAQAAVAGFAIPQCGDAFAPAEQQVDGVAAVIQMAPGAVEVTGGMLGEPLIARTSFTSTDGEPRSFLASSTAWIITRDGVVVNVDMDGLSTLELTSTQESQTSLEAAFPVHSCEAEAALAALYQEMGWDPDEPHSEAVADLLAQYQQWPSGTYQAYAVSPIVFGEQLAVAESMRALGATQVARARDDVGSTPFGKDERLSPYCFDDDGSRTCASVPPELLDEVLTFAIDPASVDTTPPGVAISAPTTFTVP